MSGSKYWKVKPGTVLWDKCVEFMKEREKVHQERNKLCNQLLGRKRKTTHVTCGTRLVGFGYETGKYPDEAPNSDLELYDDAHCGLYYRPKKRTSGGKKLAREFQSLNFNSTHSFCKELGFEQLSFDSRGMRFNDPGMRYRENQGFYLKTHEDLEVKSDQVERISDLEWEKIG
jgi:hypothetical protein